MWFANSSVNPLEQDKLVQLLHDNIPQVTWPLRKTERSNKIKSTANLNDKLCKRYLAVHTCSRGCMAFAGNSNENLSDCKICSRPRYKLGGTTPNKRLHLLPIIPKLIELIRTNDFIKILKCVRRKYGSNSNQYYSDVYDGKLYTEAMNEMNVKFNQLKDSDNRAMEKIEVSLCASIFYDGIDLFKYIKLDHNPVEIVILNLPPCFRHEFGTMFCAGVMTSKCGDGVETFFMKYCLLPELLLLFKGYKYVYQNKVYIIQMRLIGQDLDLKAWEKFYSVEQCNSKHGCPMCSFRARYCPSQKRAIHSGTSILLPIDNFTRFIGSTGRCCPIGFYNSEYKYVEYTDVFNKQPCYPNQNKELEVRPCSDSKNLLNKLNGLLPNEEYDLRELGVKEMLQKEVYLKLNYWIKWYEDKGWPEAYAKEGGDIENFYVTGTVISIRDITFNEITVYIPVFNYNVTLLATDINLLHWRPDWAHELGDNLYKTGEPDQYKKRKKVPVNIGKVPRNNSSDFFYLSVINKASVVHKLLTEKPDMFEEIKNICRSQHCDFRPQIKINLVHHDEYIANGVKVLIMKRKIKSAEVQKKAMVEGIKGISFICYLPYYQYHWNKWEPAHAIKNVIMVILELFNGDIVGSSGYIKIAEKFNLFKINVSENKAGKKTITAPWKLEQKCKYIADSFINSIVLPTGYKNNGAYYVFQQRGLLDTAACIQLATSPFLLYGLTRCEILPGYKNFLAMFIRDISDLLSPIMTKRMIEDVRFRVYELIAIKEKIFPDNASRMTFHQVVHLVDHVELSGPVGSNTGMAGERMIGKSKRYKTLGGSNATGTIVRRTEVQEMLSHSIYDPADKTGTRKTFLEKSSVKRFYNSDSNIYTEFPFKILKPELKLLNMSNFQQEHLLEACVREIRKQIQSVKEGVSKSPLYRLLISYSHADTPHNPKPSFFKFLKDLYLRVTANPNDKLPYGLKLNFDKLDKDEVQELINCEDKYDDHTVILQDLLNVITFIQGRFKVGKEGIIYGERFLCRGSDCAELEKSLDGVRVTNQKNILSDHSKEKKQYSSWAFYRDKVFKKDAERNDLPDQTFGPYKNWKYAACQLNYFFRVTIEGDEVLKNVPFACIVPRTSFLSKYKLWRFVKLTTPNYETTQLTFIPATDIRATAVAVGFLDKDYKACSVNSRHSGQSDKVDEQFSKNHIPDWLYLLPINLTRDLVTYTPDDNAIYNDVERGTI